MNELARIAWMLREITDQVFRALYFALMAGPAFSALMLMLAVDERDQDAHYTPPASRRSPRRRRL